MASANGTQPRNGRRGLVGCGGGLLGLGVVVGVVWWRLGLVLVVNPTGHYMAAQARWAQAAVPAYTLTVNVAQPFREDAVYELRVADGEVTEAVRMNPGAYRYAAAPTRFAAAPSEVAGYTVDGLFISAGRLLRDLPAVGVTATPDGTHIRYDPDYGYPLVIVENRCGLLFSSVDECLTRVEVLAFTPEPAPQT